MAGGIGLRGRLQDSRRRWSRATDLQCCGQNPTIKSRGNAFEEDKRIVRNYAAKKKDRRKAGEIIPDVVIFADGSTCGDHERQGDRFFHLE